VHLILDLILLNFEFAPQSSGPAFSVDYNYFTSPFGLVSQLEFNVPFQHKYGYIRNERSQFIEDTVEPSVFLPGIISLVIMCIGSIWNNSF